VTILQQLPLKFAFSKQIVLARSRRVLWSGGAEKQKPGARAGH
jgi:hypothetical protein